MDQLYNFLQANCNTYDVVIYRFLPHGSRKIQHCQAIKPPQHDHIKVICHDQESLQRKDYEEFLCGYAHAIHRNCPLFSLLLRHNWSFTTKNLTQPNILVHSELHSKDLEWFEQYGCIGVYWWVHAVIARDWYRYAEFDNFVKTTHDRKLFLIYNRAWHGMREYRLKFVELLLNHNLQDFCKITFNTVDQNQSWRDYQFQNAAFKPIRTDLDDWFPISQATAAASADYSPADYNCTDIEIVLETVFDDVKWHLTEKTLRPIACGQPFILASTCGSLQYLKSYGFKTFGEYIDESYDSIQDPVQRLESIVTTMTTISNLDADQKHNLWQKLRPICEHNQRLFFSRQFHDNVIGEFTNNFAQAMTKINQVTAA